MSLSYSELYFDSPERLTGTNDRPTFHLQQKIQAVKKIKVSSVVVPVTFYNINSTNQAFSVIETTGTLTVDVTITSGNYNSTTFSTELKTILDAESLANGNTLTYTVSISTITGKLTISATGDFLVSLTSSSKITGFREATTTASSATGDSVINLSGPRNIYLRSNLADVLQRDSVIKDNLNFNNVLKQIPITANSGQIIAVSFPETEFFDIMTDVSDVNFYYTDSDCNVIEFNNSPWSVSVQILKDDTPV